MKREYEKDENNERNERQFLFRMFRYFAFFVISLHQFYAVRCLEARVRDTFLFGFMLSTGRTETTGSIQTCAPFSFCFTLPAGTPVLRQSRRCHRPDGCSSRRLRQ